MSPDGKKFRVATSNKQRKTTLLIDVLFPPQDYGRLQALFREYQQRNFEGYAVAVCGLKADVAKKRHAYLVKTLFLPRAGDLIDHSSISVTPVGEFLELALIEAAESQGTVLEIHSHLDTDLPSFSAIDVENGLENGRFLRSCRTRFAMLVLGNAGVALAEYDAETDTLQTPEQASLQVMTKNGPRTVVASPPEPDLSDAAVFPESVSRQLLLWGDAGQRRIENTTVGIVGLGGTGAALLQMLGRIGVKKFVLCDPDIIEASNLSRLPYAFPGDVARKKVKVAAAYVKKIHEGLELQTVAEKVPGASDRLKGCDVLFGCVDNDGARLALNEIALRYYIPYIDTGAEIFVAGDQEIQDIGGQVRIVVPAVTGCLGCAGALDLDQAALDLLEPEDLLPAVSAGYVRGTELTPAPAVITLNTIVAAMAVQEFVAMATGLELAHNYLIYDALTPVIERLTMERNPDCPMCGRGSVLGSGDVPEKKGRRTAKKIG